MAFKTEGMEDFRKLAAKAVAITYPKSKKPPLLRADYVVNQFGDNGFNCTQWELLVKRILDEPKTGGVVVYEDTEEGQAFLDGTPTSSITYEFLMGLVDKDGDESRLRDFARLYEVKITDKQIPKVISLKILAAIADGAKPKATAPAV